MTSKRRTNASPGERDEHAPLLRAAQDLEEAMADPRPHRPHVAQRLLLKRLLVVGDCLRRHCESTEQRGGTLAELEIEIGRLYQLTAARTEHEQLLALADDLAAMLEQQEDDAAAHSSFETQSRCARLADTLRIHCVSETDLIQIRFNFDVGVCD